MVFHVNRISKVDHRDALASVENAVNFLHENGYFH
jgi:hypothetical protein